MSNKNPVHKFIKGDPKQKEIAKKGGQAKKGYKSLKTIMREIFESGDVDQKEFVRSQILEAMNGNGSLAKLLWEYHDGKVTDKIELKQTITDIQVSFIEPTKDRRTK